MDLVQKQQQQIAEQSQLVSTLTQQLSKQKFSEDDAHLSVSDKIAQSILEFNYAPEDDVTFDAWYGRYEDLFTVDGAALDDAARVRLLLRKLGPAEHQKYRNFILPKKTRNFTFDETVDKLTHMFGRQSSVFNTRYQCFLLRKLPEDDL